MPGRPGSGRRRSRRWLRTQDKIRRVHAQVADARRDYLHKLTARLVRDFDTVVVENLNVAGMSRSGGAYKRGLNRALHDAALAEIGRQVTYKTDWTGTGLHVADRWWCVSGELRTRRESSPTETNHKTRPPAGRRYRCGNTTHRRRMWSEQSGRSCRVHETTLGVN
ncbi:MAG: transposase, partial [Rhodococcus sp. (in: high G+C Gram-positive bacteria)]|uniref:transposase n=1 Tax=Rhodococcus sp. TaxID=1831 RepID=UPI003BB1E9AA